MKNFSYIKMSGAQINVTHYTKLDNITCVAKDLNCDENLLCKFFSKKLHCRIKDGCVVEAIIDQTQISHLLDEFKERYLLCPSCRMYDIIINEAVCRSCGYHKDKRKISLESLFDVKDQYTIITPREELDIKISELMKHIYEMLSKCNTAGKTAILENILNELWQTTSYDQYERLKHDLYKLTP